ncbi:GPW/gp25 family protein [Rappaport israeli]|uniref:GPW/gp25 family protein n=1 Tax=Rappaport israeli TaxID=1839807 RepID=UPI00098F3D65|nr:GPW/gp25 family protein [Rappaport israeli]
MSQQPNHVPQKNHYRDFNGEPRGALAKLGMSRHDGRKLSPQIAHIHQSLTDIFTTPIGTRIQRRDYGSHLFALIDSPMNPAGRLRLAAAVVDATYRWEPRVVITWAMIDASIDGKVTLNYQARTLDGEDIRNAIRIR